MWNQRTIPFLDSENKSEESVLLPKTTSESNGKFLKRVFIPQRYILGFMGFLGVVNAYIMRVVLSVAITEMVYPLNRTFLDNDEVCPSTNLTENANSTIVGHEHLYDWDEYTQGIILSSFYWGYVLTHLPGGILAEKFGGKYSVGLGILSTAIFTLITPTVVRNGDRFGLIILRVFIGLGEGTTFPALNAMLAKWVPVSERATLSTLVYSGAQMGNVVGNAASGLIIEATQQWESPFYIFGCMGILWFLLWTLLCYSEPNSHPFISENERKLLQKELVGISVGRRDTPWKAILTSVPLWALVAAQIGHDWGLFTMVTNLPKYMKTVLKFNIKESGIWSSLPYLVMWFTSMLSSWLCDWLIMKKYVGVTFARKFFTIIASLVPSIFIMAASYAGCDQINTVILFTVGMGFMGVFYCGMKVNALDLSPNFAGTVMAIVNGLGALTGIITPYLAGVLTEDQTLSQWRMVFWITFVVFIVTAIIYSMCASGEEQWWNAPENHKVLNSTNVEAGASKNKKCPLG